ncbi:MAG: cupredoxin domain-containing protein [Cyanobacteria bacterium SZAS LIN-3]|nr:cupredoxin domain-containing protein [Cyanobacteria bacterium SZAS LIN-3]MBS2005475.1 cupredoxin domain-containing protein [Cyanobacteria bacterium SZAS TMP-1]
MNLSRLAIGLVLAAAAGQVLHTGACAVAAEKAQVIKVVAKKFEFSPKKITLKRGQPVVIQLTSEDRLHGFSIPSMDVRADVSPGKVAEVKVTPQKTGEYEFYCDVFCGFGHEDMSGKIVVTD